MFHMDTTPSRIENSSKKPVHCSIIENLRETNENKDEDENENEDEKKTEKTTDRSSSNLL